jgi:hypothetical protein
VAKIIRNLSTKESKTFWSSAEVVAAQVQDWPASRRAGINVPDSNEATVEEPKVTEDEQKR